MDLFEAGGAIGGQFGLARQIPGKEEFAETLRYFRQRLDETGVRLHLNRRVSAPELLDGGYDRVLLATGVVPRRVELPGIDRPNVHAYPDVVSGRVRCGPRVAIIGAGGVGHDVAGLLTEPDPAAPQAPRSWHSQWGVDPDFADRGGLTAADPGAPARRALALA